MSARDTYNNNLWAAINGNGAAIDALTQSRQKGKATLVAGAANVTGITMTASSVVTLSYNTPGGTRGFLDARDANRVNGVGSGSMVITSSSNTDTSTVDWTISG